MTDAERILNELILNVGKVTAYADAVAGGYTGTREEWEEALAGIGSEAAAALAAKNAAEAAQTAAETAQSAAETAAGAAGTAASSAADDASDAHIDALAATAAKEAAQTAQGLAEDAKASAIAAKGAAETAQEAAEAAQTAAETAASAASTSAEGAALSEDAAAASAQAAAGSAEDAREVLESIPEDYSAMSADVTDLKSAIDGKFDSMFVSIANDKCTHGSFRGVDYTVSGNVIAMNGTSSAAIRMKFSGNAFDIAGTIPDSWREEQIGLIPGHEYILCGEYVSGTGRIEMTIYATSGYTQYVVIDSITATPGAILYSARFTASATNSTCLCAYTAGNKTFDKFKARFGLLDVTAANDVIWDKLDGVNNSITTARDYISNRNASLAAIDIIGGSGDYTYENLSISIRGNKIVLNGANTTSLRVKLSGQIAVSHNWNVAWQTESIPVLEPTHKHAIALTCVSGSAGTTIARVSLADANGNGVANAYITNENGFSTGVKFSEPVESAENICCMYLYCSAGGNFTNVELQTNLVDLAVLSHFNEPSKEAALNEYYHEGGYIEDRVKDIEELIAANSIDGDSFLWFTDPHFFRPTSSAKENGMQSVELAEYLRNRLNTRMIVCGGDLVRGMMTKEVCRDALIRAREYMAPIYDDMYMALGNHEYNNPGKTSSQRAQQLDSPELYSLFIKNREADIDAISVHGDYTFANHAQKARYFVLGCNYAAEMFPESVAWFAKRMQIVEEGYRVIVISHIGISTPVEGEPSIVSPAFVDIAAIMDAAKSGGSYTYSGTEYNYSACDVVCALTGHVHYDGSVVTSGGIPIIATTCDRAFIGSDGDDGVREVRKIGTIGEQAMDYVIIDFDARTIDLIRIGGSILGAAWDSNTGKVYDAAEGTGTEYTGSEWIVYSPYKDRHFTY